MISNSHACAHTCAYTCAHCPLSTDAREFQLCVGLPAFLVKAPAMAVHSDKFQAQAQEQEEKGRLEELEKQWASMRSVAAWSWRWRR